MGRKLSIVWFGLVVANVAWQVFVGRHEWFTAADISFLQGVALFGAWLFARPKPVK